MDQRNKVLRILRSIAGRGKKLTFLVLNILTQRIKPCFIESIELWVEKQNRTNKEEFPFDCHPRAWYKKYTDETETLRLDDRFSDSEFRTFRTMRWSIGKAINIYYLPGSTIMGLSGIIASTDRRIFKQLTYPPSHDRAWRYREVIPQVYFSPAIFKPGWYTTLVGPFSDSFAHWMIDILPRLAVLDAYIGLFDGIIIACNPSPFQVESLTALGIASNKLVETSPRMNLKLEHFFATNYSARDNPPAWLHVWYKEKFIRPLALRVDAGRRIYVSRADAARRKAINYEEVHRMVAELGFEVVTLSKLSFIEQAKLFYTSDIILGEHGAGLANLVFCRKGTKVIEILSVFWMSPTFFSLSRSAELEYYPYVLESREIRATIAEKIDSELGCMMDMQRCVTYKIDSDDLRQKMLNVISR